MDPILDITTSRVRRIVKIDGEPYEIISTDELSFANAHSLSSFGQRLGEVFRSPDSTDEQLVEASQQLDALVSRVLLAPDRVRAKLTDIQKMQVLQAVFQLPGVGSDPTSSQSSSPGSSDSTEETPASGTSSPTAQ